MEAREKAMSMPFEVSFDLHAFGSPGVNHPIASFVTEREARAFVLHQAGMVYPCTHPEGIRVYRVEERGKTVFTAASKLTPRELWNLSREQAIQFVEEMHSEKGWVTKSECQSLIFWIEKNLN